MDSPVVLSREIKAQRERDEALSAKQRPLPAEDDVPSRPPTESALRGMPKWMSKPEPQPYWPQGMPAPRMDAAEEDEPLADTHDELDLSSLLNCLDGTLEMPGRMVIMTSNHPEMLDSALTRKVRPDPFLLLLSTFRAPATRVGLSHSKGTGSNPGKSGSVFRREEGLWRSRAGPYTRCEDLQCAISSVLKASKVGVVIS